ncbi:hypothetical protein H9L19_08025 [Weissella diestrammenae]|uniref:Peptidase M10 metallopeptidase domain-containing protein n=1 Tax=Weissella diestrammenae TaxID=1162633 RepID=A0A7G9T5C2_9LACO|nr:hypothetical protein [Weissella diestrammenae]QNN75297.1 hypothetical protein H9L19_08025 [Weissella diestrammenae]
MATDHVLVQIDANGGRGPIQTFLGEDGILQIHTQSRIITEEVVRAAANLWNTIAGAEIIKYVVDPALSDEIIHDLPSIEGSTTLMGQTYNGEGIVCYPDNFHLENLSESNRNNQLVALAAHEMGHAIGIAHLGGGRVGNNAGESEPPYFGHEFMSTWTVEMNPVGVTSTLIDAAVLALVAHGWEKPRSVAEWAISGINKDSSVTSNDLSIDSITNTIPWGYAVDQISHTIQDNEPLYKKVKKNFNVYNPKINIDDVFAKHYFYRSDQIDVIGTTGSLNLIDELVLIERTYESADGYFINKVNIDNQIYYIFNDAFE